MSKARMGILASASIAVLWALTELKPWQNTFSPVRATITIIPGITQ